MVYRTNKGIGIPAKELQGFRDRIEAPMDAAWAAIAPFEREVWLDETKGKKWLT